MLRRDARHLLGALRRRRLLEPERHVRLQPLGEPLGAGGRELPVRAEQQIAFVADRRADRPAEGVAQVQPLEARLARIERRIGAGGIEFHRREALADIFERPRRRGVRVAVDRVVGVGVRAAVGIEIGIAAQLLVDLAAEQRVDRFLDRFADEVPHRHLDPGEHAHQRNVGPPGIAAAVDVAPQRLDLERVGAEHVMFEHVLDHRNDRLGAEARGIDFAQPLDPVVGDELQKQEISPAERRRRISDDEGLQFDDPHGRPPVPSLRGAQRRSHPAGRRAAIGLLRCARNDG